MIFILIFQNLNALYIEFTSNYSTYLKFGNAQENLMEKGIFLGVPENSIFVGLRRIFFGRSHYE
jgi:hypothetical protein